MSVNVNVSRPLVTLPAYTFTIPPDIPALLFAKWLASVVSDTVSKTVAMMLTEPPDLLALQPVNWQDSTTNAEFDSVWSYKKFTAPPFVPLAAQFVNVDVVNVTGLVAESRYSTSMAPPRLALQLAATTVVAMNALDVTTPLTCAERDPPYPVAVHVVNVTSVRVTGDIDATPLPYDR